jgi:ComEC/Rec2-related protein
MAYILARPFIYIFSMMTVANLCVRNSDQAMLGLLCALCLTAVCILLAWMALRRKISLWTVMPALAAAFTFHSANHSLKQLELKQELPPVLKGEYTIVVERMRQYPSFALISGSLINGLSARASIMTPNQLLTHVLFHGDTLKAKLSLLKLEPTNSRHIQAFQRYLQHKGFQYEGQMLGLTEIKTGNNSWRPLRISQILATKFKRALEKCSKDERTTQLITGLLLGDKSGMDREMKEAFREGGLSHILAVSGMHLGILYGMLKLAFIPLRKQPFRSLLRFENAILLLLLWAFVFITGCEVAAFRAVVMLSLFLMAKKTRRNTCPVNVLFATAFALQVGCPDNLFDVGYQLSCVAVLAIFLIYPSIKRILYPKSRMLRWLWEASAVSLSVQMLIMPLCLYHFSSFPVHFSLTNILWLPLTPAIMFAGILGAGAQLLHADELAAIVMTVASVAVQAGIKGLLVLNELPFSNLKCIYLEAEDLWLYYLEYLYIGSTVSRTICHGLLRVSMVAVLFTIMYSVRELAFSAAPEILVFAKSGKLQCELYYQYQAWSTAPDSKVATAYRLRKRTGSIYAAEPDQIRHILATLTPLQDPTLKLYTGDLGSKTIPMPAKIYKLSQDIH